MPHQNMRAMVLLLGDTRVRIPFHHMACVIWRPHMYPHFLAAPAAPDSARPYSDVVRACQLGSRTTDKISRIHAHAALPPFILEERKLRTERLAAAAPEIPTDALYARTVAVYKALNMPPPA